MKKNLVSIFVSLAMVVFFASSCTLTKSTTAPSIGYKEWIASCKDYKDVAKWMDENFLYDTGRLYSCLKTYSNCEVYSPETTYEKKTGICFDAAVFAKWSLNRINPKYKAEIITLYSGVYGEDIPDHYVTGFYIDGKLFILDYGVALVSYRQRGTWGPFKNLDEYVQTTYNRLNRHGDMKKFQFGWPEHRKYEKW